MTAITETKVCHQPNKQSQASQVAQWFKKKKERERDLGLIPELERPPGEGNGNALQYFCLENPWTEEPGGLQSMESQKESDIPQ